MKIGAQLFTVREFTQTVQDFAQTIKKIADIGYKYVQISAIGAIPAQEVANICNDNGIGIVVTHTNPTRIKNETEAVIADHNIMGAKYVGIGAMPGDYERTVDGVRRFISDFMPAAELLQSAGMQLMYHNHDFEFEKYDGKRMIEYLQDEFKHIGFILDSYWVQAAGGDPSDWLTRLSGRVPVIHFKDMAWVQGRIRMAEVMEGNINWSALFAACKSAGVDYAMVEQDDCYGADPFECLRTSFNNLKKSL